MIQKEVWKDVKNYEGLYQVSNIGRVKSLDRITICKRGFEFKRKGRILSEITDKKGYKRISLSRLSRIETFVVHQLVAIAFLNHKPNGHKIVVDHIDNNKANNKVSNLQLLTNRENCSKDKKGTSKYTGVSWCSKIDKWKSGIFKNQKTINIGYFEKEYDAHLAYQKILKS